jgi:hypothetical protein
MPRGHTFKSVEAFGRTLPDVEATTTWGKPALKVRGRMFVCIASHKSAEPNTLVVMMDFETRDALLEDDPGTYYLKEHYLNYPCGPRSTGARPRRRAARPRRQRLPAS